MSKFSYAAAVTAGTILLSVFPALAQSTPPATLKLDMKSPRAKVSPKLYGLMTEEINFSYDGGLYAEMVRNRTFHEQEEHWFLIEDGNASASMSIDKTTGPSAALPLSQKIEIKQADADDQAGIINDGYWGFALQPHTSYKGSFYAKADTTNPDPVEVSLVSNKTGKAVATATVPAVTEDWARYDFTLRTDDTPASAANHLAIKAGHAGTLWLSLVSIFPPTYHDRTNGNRVDLMEKLAAMHPAFLRFPGGNYLEGDHVYERYEWKTTIGPLVDRPTHPSPWRYHSSDGLGLLEFLEWCEDLHMQPLLAVYAGYSMAQEHIDPGTKLDPFVQDALDEIEYVTGSTSTKWGAERAKDGHPEPFHLSYVEVGNEDFFDRSGSYEGRFPQFYKAIKAKYPELQIIATTPVKSIRPDVVDDHYYRRATDFYADTRHYDKTDRTGPKIFVGEWATREGAPTPNFGSALGDAAWMTGMERNSDIVIMAAYAPLLVNVNPGGMQWESDLIGYTADKSYGSPSYYAQVIFGKYLGQEIVKGELAGANPRCFYSATYSPEQGKLFLKLVNASSKPQALSIQLDGAATVEKTGEVVSLSATNTQETNTITEPENIVPVERPLKEVGSTFNHTLPPYSIQVLEIGTK